MFKKRAFYFCFIILFLFSTLFPFPAFAQSSADLQALQKATTEAESVTAYQNLLAYLQEENINVVSARSNVSAPKGLCEAYGGAYLDEDGNLVVNLTDASAAVRSELSQASQSNTIKYNVVSNSLEVLNAAYSKLITRLETAPYFKVVLSETKNTVEVYTDHDLNVCAAYVAELVDMSLITLIPEDDAFTDCALLHAGDDLACLETAGAGTVGFPCSVDYGNGIKYTGFVTAAHIIRSPNGSATGHTVSVSGKSFGTVQRMRYGNTVDAAFIKKDSSILPPWWILTSRLSNGESIDGWRDSSITPEGSTVRKFGITTGITQGTVISHRASITVNGYPFYSLTQTTLLADYGDSGGPCIRSIGNENYLVGIMKGKDSSGYTYYCRMDQIIKELNVTPMV